jgi:tellurite resistance protein TerC
VFAAAVLSFAIPLSCHCSKNVSPQLCASTGAAEEDEDVSIFFQQSVRTDLVLQENVSARTPSRRTTLAQAVGHDTQLANSDIITNSGQQNFYSVMRWLNMTMLVGSWPFEWPLPPMSAILPEKEAGLDRWETADTIAIVMVLLLLIGFDVFIAPRIPSTMANHLLVLGLMLLQSVAFCGLVYVQRGRSDCVAWATGFVVEIALSMDNLFIFHLVFQKFKVVESDRVLYALTFGIYGAVFLRVIFILALTKLFQIHYSVDIAIGALLIISGICTLYDDDEDVADLYTVKFFQWLFGDRLKDETRRPKNGKSDQDSSITNRRRFVECQLFSEDESGKTQITVLCLVVCILSVVDVFFAVDSVGSKTGQIKNIYINLSSSLLAMFSLRALFFIVKDLSDFFDYVKYGICGILCFVGLEMMVSKWYEIPLATMCAVIAALFTISVLASIAKVAIYGVDKDNENEEHVVHHRIADA